MKHFIDSYRRSINPPYTGKDAPVILGTLGILTLMVAFIVFGQQQRQEYAGAVGTPAYLMMKIPPNNPARGLIYDGLEEDTTGVCKGLLKLKSSNPALDRAQCTHGPDPAPEGVDITKSVLPISENNQNQPVLGTAVTCDGDGVSGKRIQVIYARASDRSDRYNQYLTSFRTWSADMDSIFLASAAETGGSRNVRFVHDASCIPDVQNVILSTTGDDNFGNTRNELKAKGYNRSDRKYLVFVDDNFYCGIAEMWNSDIPGSTNPHNSGPDFSRVDAGCWNGPTAAHEIMHTLGGVQISAPHTSSSWHCVDEYDNMCYSDYPYYPPMQYLCPSSHENRFDCNHDDYYHTNPPAGSYLTTHWNTATNAFLIGAPILPTPTVDPNATPTATLTPAPTSTGTFSVSGTIYIDANSNGVFDIGEAPYAGGLVDAWNNDTNGFIATRTSASNGVYLFSNNITGGFNYRFQLKTNTAYTITSTNPVIRFISGNVTNVHFGVRLTTPPTPTNTPTPTPIPSGDITKPTITITSPQSGTVVNRRANVTIAATASDNVAVDRVEFSVGGSLSIDYTAPYSYVWSVPGKPNATYIIKATAYDTSNNSSSQSITVTSSR